MNRTVKNVHLVDSTVKIYHAFNLTPVIGNKNNIRFFKSSEHINKKGDGPYCDFAQIPGRQITF